MDRLLSGTSSRQRVAGLLLLASVVLIAAQIWNIAAWKGAFDDGQSQEERVAIYLARLPAIARQLGVHGFTWVLVLTGVVSSAAAYVSARLQPDAVARAFSRTAMAISVLLTLWYLFTLM